MANLVLIAVMVAIFGAALLLPFPRARGVRTPRPTRDPAPDAGMRRVTSGCGPRGPAAAR